MFGCLLSFPYWLYAALFNGKHPGMAIPRYENHTVMAYEKPERNVSHVKNL